MQCSVRLRSVHGIGQDRTGDKTQCPMFGATWDTDMNRDKVGQHETKKVFFCTTKIGGTIWERNKTETKILLIDTRLIYNLQEGKKAEYNRKKKR